jgi:hypothetical protein
MRRIMAGGSEPRENDRVPLGEVAMPRSSAQHSTTPITWEIDVPLLTNPLVVGPTIKGFLIAGTMMWALLAFLFAVQGEWDLIGTMAIFSFGLTAVMVVVGLIGTVFVLGNRMRFRFTVDAKGATSDRIDRRAAATDKLAMLFGLLAGKPGAVGAGMLSASQATTRVAWSSVARVKPHPRMHAIGLHNVWRTTAVLYCPADRFDEILATVRTRTGEASPSRRRNPLPGLLLRTALVVLACLPLFTLPTKIDLFAPIFVQCFALASVWLVPQLAWAVFGGLGAVAFAAVVAAQKPFKSWITGEMIHPYDVYFPDDWLRIGLAVAGAAYLVWLGIRLLRGRVEAGLAGDLAEAENDRS